MSNHGLSSEQARAIGAKTLWIGDIETWMDEQYIMGLFNKYAVVQQVKLIRDKLKGQPVGYGFVEFPSHEIAKTVFHNLNGQQIQGTQRNYKLNWASHGTSRHQQNHQGGPGGVMQRQESMGGGPGGAGGAHNMNTPKMGGGLYSTGGSGPHMGGAGGEEGNRMMGGYHQRGPGEAGAGGGPSGPIGGHGHSGGGASASAGGAAAPGSEAQVYVGNLDSNVNSQMLLAAFKKNFPNCYDAKIIIDPVTKNSKGFGFIKFGSHEAAQQCIETMQGHYILSRQIRLGYAAQKRQPGENRNNQSQQSQFGQQQQQQPQSQYYGGPNAAGAGGPQSSYYGNYGSGMPPPPPQIQLDYYGNPISGGMGMPYYQGGAMPNQPGGYGGVPQHQQQMYGGGPGHPYHMYQVPPGYEQPWMGGLPPGSQGPHGSFQQQPYGQQSQHQMGQPGGPNQPPVGGLGQGAGAPSLDQGPRPYGDMYDQGTPGAGGQDDRQNAQNHPPMMPGSAADQHQQQPPYGQPNMMSEMGGPQRQPPNVLGQEQLGEPGFGPGGPNMQPQHPGAHPQGQSGEQHLPGMMNGQQLGASQDPEPNIVKAPLLQDKNMPPEQLEERNRADQQLPRNEVDADANKQDTDTSDQHKQNSGLDQQNQSGRPPLLGNGGGMQQQQQPYTPEQMHAQVMMPGGMPPQMGMMYPQGGPPPRNHPYAMHYYPHQMHRMMGPGQNAMGPMDQHQPHQQQVAPKAKQQRQGSVRLTSQQVDELNQQFLSEVFADPEVLHVV